MGFRLITKPQGHGHQPSGTCPTCGLAVVKGVCKELGLVYKCARGHIGAWDSRSK